MRSAWKTDRGLVRENNEDTVLVDEQRGLFLLADGMGGGPAGEVASGLAVSAAHEFLARHLAEATGAELELLLKQALLAAHNAVLRQAVADVTLKGMGTTLEILLVREREAVFCHVGDSRIYRFRRGEERQLTRDDNYAAYIANRVNIASDRIPPAYRHILTQAVGVSSELNPALGRVALEPGDLFLICSDGLTEALDPQGIAALIRQQRGNLPVLADQLVAAALDRGGADNVSVVLVEPLSDRPVEHLF